LCDRILLSLVHDPLHGLARRNHEAKARPEQLLMSREEQGMGIPRRHEHPGVGEAGTHEPQGADPLLRVVVDGREDDHPSIAGVAPELAPAAVQQQDGNAASAQAAGEAEGIPRGAEDDRERPLPGVGCKPALQLPLLTLHHRVGSRPWRATAHRSF
jgi:hypothetical protein